jgi:hypothetical protein
MKIILGISFLSLIILFGCSTESTGPEPVPGESQISVTGDITESYKVTATFGTSTYTSDTTEKEYFSIILFPNTQGSNPFAFTILFKFGPELPSSQSYTVGKHALGDDIPAGQFGGGFSGINTEDFAGYTMNQGTITFTSVSGSIISGDINMSGYWAQGFEEDSTRTVNITGNFHATPMPEN